MKRLSQTIIDLIVLAEQVITQPARHEYRGLAEIAAEVRHADALPAEGLRTTRAALMLVIAIEEHRDCDPGRGFAGQWLMIAGALLPLARLECWIAVNNEREQAK